MSINAQPVVIDDIFINKRYYIDFYQREYKWEKEHVIKLLEDIFYKFQNEYKEEMDTNLEAVIEYSWYYMNAYMTNSYGGKTFIVDGQQRFTTITLILIKLYHLCKKYELDERSEWIKNKIFGTGAEGKSYWMGDNNRDKVLEDLFCNGKKNIDIQSYIISIKNIYKNYGYIDDYLNKELYSKHKFETFLLYFLRRIYFVNINIENLKDVPMVFEVINDRGNKLKPYEVFKGQLLGQLDKTEIDQYYKIWTNNINNLNAVGEKEIDDFFRFYFRAKYIDTPADYKNFDGDYNKIVFNDKWDEKFNLKSNPKEVKRFIREDFDFYCKLYVKLITQVSRNENSYVFFNAMNKQNMQYMLIMSSIQKGEEYLDEKINLVSKLFDRYYTLLQLLGCYDSNLFNDSIVKLNIDIRNKSVKEIEYIFNKKLLADINNIKNINVSDPFQWLLFKEANNSLGLTFLRYFFARIDHFISSQTNLPTDKYINLIRHTGSVNGFHIEHILADNEENKKIFNNDEELFYTQRNYLGALLLLKGRDNQSSGKEIYENKLKTYEHQTLWAQTLTENFYHCNKGLDDLKKQYKLNLHSIKKFDKQAIEERQRLLFELVKVIWK